MRAELLVRDMKLRVKALTLRPWRFSSKVHRKIIFLDQKDEGAGGEGELRDLPSRLAIIFQEIC